ncbi:MAG: LamG domain-containing protein, partial [Planctomycetota bacterium]
MNKKLVFIMLSLMAIPAYGVHAFKVSNHGGGTQIWFEVEHFDERNPDDESRFALSDEPGAYGRSINSLDTGGDASGYVRYTFNIGAAGGSAGTWYFWGRVINPSNQSDFMLVDGHPGDQTPVTSLPVSGLANGQRVFEENQGSAGNWAWSGDSHNEGHTKELQDGENTMWILNRQSGAIWDVFMWTDDPGYVPTDADYENAIPGGGYGPATKPFPEDGALLTDTWISLNWRPGDFAVSHDVYFSESFDDVNDRAAGAFRGNQGDDFFVVGFPGMPYPDGLVPGTTYYWRVDEVNDADPNSPWRGPVWSFWLAPNNAYAPSPADGVRYIDTEPTLAWEAGFGAKLHNVVFGDNFDDVNNAPAGAPQAGATYNPGTLEPDKTYYWRVDQFNPPTTTKGEVWSFTTMPVIPVGDPDLIGWWKFDEGMGKVAVDMSGHGNHGELRGDPQWVSGLDGGALDFDGSGDFVFTGKNAADLGIEGAKPKSVAAWVYTRGFNNGGIFDLGARSDGQDFCLRTMASVSDWRTQYWGGAFDHDFTYNAHNLWVHFTLVYTGTQSTVYANGVPVSSEVRTLDTSVTNPFQIACYGWQVSYFNGIIDDVRLYNKALTVEEIEQAMRGDTTRAWGPSPANGAITDVFEADSVSWSAGDSVSQHAVYFGTDADAVVGADESDTTGVFRGLQAGTSYVPPEGIAWGGGSYYWRIDQHNTDGSITTGTVWTFFVADYIIVDDMESYTGGNPSWENWRDGVGFGVQGQPGFYPGNGTGSAAGDDTVSSTVEESTVHGGGKALPVWYNNTTAATSEIELTLSAAQNWTTNDLSVLSIWFFGDPGNVPGQLYVKANGRQVLYNGASADLTKPMWQVWNVDLASFGGGLESVTTVALGVQGSGATGKLIFDDITLNQSVPEPAAQAYLEAEAGTLGASWRLFSDPGSVGGQHIGSNDGDGGDNDVAPGPEWTASYSFDVPAGVYKIVFRVQEVTNDSFWVRIVGATGQTHEDPDQPGTGWVRFNGIDAPSG